MKIPAGVISTILVLLLAGAVEAQTMNPGPQGGVSRPGVMRAPIVGSPPVPGRHPIFFRPSFFGHPPFFFGSGLDVSSSQVAPPTAYVYSYGYAYPVYTQSPAYGQSQPQYWAYCQARQGYYPYVAECPGAWLPVAATSTPPPLGPGPTTLDTSRQPKEAPTGGTSIEELRERIARSRAD